MLFLKKKKLMAFLSLILVSLMLFSMPAFAFDDLDDPVSSDDTTLADDGDTDTDDGDTDPDDGETEIEEEPVIYDKELVLENFNSSVNRLKTDFPKFSYASVSGMLVPKKQGGLLGLVGDFTSVLGNLIGNFTDKMDDSFSDLLGKLFQPGTMENDFKTVNKGEDNRSFIPVRGKDYVSALDIDDDFTYDYTPFSFGGFNLTIDFPDTINPDMDSPLYKVFDMPTLESIYTMFYGFTDEVDWSMVQLKITNASLTCRVNQKNELSYYRTHYEVAITEIAGFDLTNFNFPESMYVNEVEIQNIDWEPRKLGDGNGDGVIMANDARECLRISARLSKANSIDFPYYDVNKDGKITSTDARLILRASARLLDLEKEYGKV